MDLTQQLVVFMNDNIFIENTKKLMNTTENVTFNQISDYWLGQFVKYRGYWEINFNKLNQKNIIIDNESDRVKHIADPKTAPTYQTSQVNQVLYTHNEWRPPRTDTNGSYTLRKK
jgi:hypothetical protein